MSIVARYLPVIGVGLFFFVGLVWRPWLQYRRYGDPGVILFRSARSGQHLRDGMFVLLLTAAAVQAVVLAVSPAVLDGLVLPGEHPVGFGPVIGGLLLLGGTGLMAAAQLQLGASWRIGIDEGARPGLMTGGLYRFCRNPIFLGMFVILAGLAVLLPTWLSAAALVGAVACVRWQVAEEEAYLLCSYGEEYREFAGRVGRFLPGVGRLR
ncbi:MAG: hypothetical protein JWO38_424 [Gemmataceae bacterium]|nr:hypothetical protein [Gemmataceae bacterium]